jgi:hypothetical protein
MTAPAAAAAIQRRHLCMGLLGSTWAAAARGGAEPDAARSQANESRDALQVGPGRSLRSLGDAARLARDRQRIEVDAGEYRADTAVFAQNELRWQAVGGRVRVVSDGASAQGKALFVSRGRGIVISGFDFVGCVVPSRNGAGIRLEAGSLTVEDCRFLHNECGILTANEPDISLEVRDCEFGWQRRADGRNHHLYAGGIGRLTVLRSDFHHAAGGHLIKSRAALSVVRDNRLLDGPGGQASYELEFPNGGQITVVGNVIEQGASSENGVIVSCGAEGYGNTLHSLRFTHNTLINRRPGPMPWVRVLAGAVQGTVRNNLWAGANHATALELPPSVAAAGNFGVALDELEAPDDGDHRLRPSSQAHGRGLPEEDATLRPTQSGRLLQPGAVQSPFR